MPEKCGVCSEQDSKYKCPHCLLRYCSVKCFKVHLTTHEEDEQPATAGADTDTTQQQSNPSPAVQPTSPPTTVHPLPRAPKRSLNDIKDDPRMAHLFIRYPNLRSQLQEIFAMTLPSYQNGGGEGETTSTNGAGHGHGNDHASHFQRKKNQISGRGQWSQEKADKGALRRLADVAARDEGIREFVELCAVVGGAVEED